MARGFNSLGVANTDAIVGTYGGGAPLQATVAGWTYEVTDGAALHLLPRVFVNTDGNINNWTWLENSDNVAGTHQLGTHWTTTDGNWTWTRPALLQWHHTAIVLDSSSTAN